MPDEKGNVWYLPGPNHQYNEDVKALAREAGLRIVDANVTADRANEATEVPSVTKKADLQAVEDDGKTTVAQIKGALAKKGVAIPDGVTKKADLQALLDGQA